MLASRKENNSITYSTGIICSTVFEIRLLDFTRTPRSRNLRIRGIYILIDRTVASISVFVIEHICMHVPIHVQPLLQREPAVSTDARYESEKEQGLGGGGGGETREGSVREKDRNREKEEVRRTCAFFSTAMAIN